MDIFQTLLTWQFLLLCLTVSAIMFVVKQTSVYLFNKYYKLKKFLKFWNDVLLPILPIFIGGLLVKLAPGYPYPESLKDFGSKLFFGITAGLFSGVVYRVLKSLLLSNIKGTEDPDDTLINSVKTILKNKNTNNNANNQ